MSTTSLVGESSWSGDLAEDLPPSTPQPGNIPDFDNLNFSIVTNTIVKTTGDDAPTQVEEPIIDTSGKGISVEASIEKAFAVNPIFEDAIQEGLTVPNLEAPLVTSEIR